MSFFYFFFFNDTATTEIYTLSLHDALPIYVEAVRRADVLEVDAADGRLEQLAEPDHVVRVLRADLKVEHVDVGERLEQDTLALHHRLPRERPDVAEPEHGSPVRHHRYQVALRRVRVGLLRPPGDFAARLRHPRGVGEGQVA